jgi:hypothetical protein
MVPKAKATAAAAAAAGWGALPEDVVCSLLHDFLNGPLLPLRLVCQRWSELILRAIGVYASLRIRRLPLDIPRGYIGRVALWLTSLKIGDAGVASLSEALRASPASVTTPDRDRACDRLLRPRDTLNAPECTDGAIIDHDIVRQREALLINGCVTRLNLRGNHIGASGAQALSEALRVTGSLTRLDLGHNRIGCSGARALGKALSVTGSLIELFLSHNHIGDAGAQALGEALHVNGRLTKLALGSNQIGGAGAQALGEALRVNGSLTKLL